jgi:hypothetical protein
LPQRSLIDYAAVAVDGDALSHFDTEVPGAGAACFQCIE